MNRFSKFVNSVAESVLSCKLIDLISDNGPTFFMTICMYWDYESIHALNLLAEIHEKCM